MVLPNIIVSPPFKYDHSIYAHIELPLENAIEWVAKSNPINRCTSPTCKVFGLEPIIVLETTPLIDDDNDTPIINDYEDALLLLSHKPLETDRDYTKGEIEAGGITCLLIIKLPR